jgi:hypothetical protein
MHGPFQACKGLPERRVIRCKAAKDFSIEGWPVSSSPRTLLLRESRDFRIFEVAGKGRRDFSGFASQSAAGREFLEFLDLSGAGRFIFGDLPPCTTSLEDTC